MSDAAVYKRTRAGERELVRARDIGATARLRMLARVNGFTDLRRLIDLSPIEGPEIAHAIRQLFDDGLIELVDDEAAGSKQIWQR